MGLTARRADFPSLGFRKQEEVCWHLADFKVKLLPIVWEILSLDQHSSRAVQATCVARDSMKYFRTVTCFIKCRGRILILKRAPSVHVNPSLRSPVAGRIRSRVSPEMQAYKEIREETGIERRKLRLVKRGRKYTLQISASVRASVQPFLFESTTIRVRLNWENTDYRWVEAANLSRFRLIPKFDLTLKALELR